jgi:hypothetical protein
MRTVHRAEASPGTRCPLVGLQRNCLKTPKALLQGRSKNNLKTLGNSFWLPGGLAV